MKQTQNNSFDSQQVLSVIEQYSTALDLLDAYDHQTMERPKGNEAAYVLTYEECMHVIACMRFGKESDLFGKEKGWILMCTDGFSLGWAKLTGTVLKNHYPKGLRWM